MQYIETTFQKIAYPHNYISSAHRQVKKKFFAQISAVNSHEIKPTIKLPFNNFTNSVINRIFRSENIQIAHTAQNTLRAKLHKTRPMRKGEGGVYIIPCAEEGCEKAYYGQTGRTLEKRLEEHKYYVRRNMKSKAVYKHMHEADHAIKWDKARMVYFSKNEKQRLVVESALLNRLENFNIMPGVCSVSSYVSKLILMANPDIF